MGRVGLVGWIVVLVLAAAPVFAQDAPAFDIAGGYQYLRDVDLEENLHGFFVEAAGALTPAVSIVGDVSIASNTYVVLGAKHLDLVVSSFLGGARISGWGSKSVVPFGQVLFGAERASATMLGETESTTRFAVQPAGGVDVMITPEIGIRAAGFYRRVFADEGVNELGVQLGLVLTGGSR